MVIEARLIEIAEMLERNPNAETRKQLESEAYRLELELHS